MRAWQTGLLAVVLGYVAAGDCAGGEEEDSCERVGTRIVAASTVAMRAGRALPAGAPKGARGAKPRGCSKAQVLSPADKETATSETSTPAGGDRWDPAVVIPTFVGMHFAAVTIYVMLKLHEFRTKRQRETDKEPAPLRREMNEETARLRRETDEENARLRRAMNEELARLRREINEETGRLRDEVVRLRLEISKLRARDGAPPPLAQRPMPSDPAELFPWIKRWATDFRAAVNDGERGSDLGKRIRDLEYCLLMDPRHILLLQANPETAAATSAIETLWLARSHMGSSWWTTVDRVEGLLLGRSALSPMPA
jgi:hypothetical protein